MVSVFEYLFKIIAADEVLQSLSMVVFSTMLIGVKKILYKYLAICVNSSCISGVPYFLPLYVCQFALPP